MFGGGWGRERRISGCGEGPLGPGASPDSAEGRSSLVFFKLPLGVASTGTEEGGGGGPLQPGQSPWRLASERLEWNAGMVKVLGGRKALYSCPTTLPHPPRLTPPRTTRPKYQHERGGVEGANLQY